MERIIKTKKQREGESLFIGDVIEGFKDFVLDSMNKGIHDDFDDHNEFLKKCFETYMEQCEVLS